MFPPNSSPDDSGQESARPYGQSNLLTRNCQPALKLQACAGRFFRPVDSSLSPSNAEVLATQLEPRSIISFVFHPWRILLVVLAG
jgi:hypothetical protein